MARHVYNSLLLFLVLVLSSSLLSFSPQTIHHKENKDTRSEAFITPPPRADKLITYQKVKNFSLNNTKRQNNIESKKNVKNLSFNGRSPLLGKLGLKFSNLDKTSDSVEVVLEFQHKTKSFKLFEKININSQGLGEISFPGQPASEITVSLKEQKDQNYTLNSMTPYEITFSDSYRIMVVGNSIAYGRWADDQIGFRKVLYDKLVESGFDIDFVGSYGDPPYEGYFVGAMKIDDFYPASLGGQARADMTAAMNDYRPNMVVIHLGTNDINTETSTPVAPYSSGNGFAETQTGQMATLVDYILKWNNGEFGTDLEKIIVSQLIPLDAARDSSVAKFNIENNRMVRNFSNGTITGQNEPVYLGDPYTRFRENPDIWTHTGLDPMEDELHPNTLGHTIMGNVYYETSSQLLGKPPKWFSDKTWESGLYGLDYHFGFQGVTLADITQNETDDIYITRSAAASPESRDVFYNASSSLPLVETAENISIEDNGESMSAVFVDIDGDGDLDLFNANKNSRNRLYKNNGAGTFTEITVQAGIGNISSLTTAVLAFDCENDGDMDLFALNSRAKNEFYLNNGTGQFTKTDCGLDDVLEPDIPNSSAIAADFDQDGDVDVYVLKRYAPNKLFINNGSGLFTDQAASAGIALNHKSNGGNWADLDKDGDLDLLVSVSSTDSDPNPHVYVYKNNGNGTFQNISNDLNIPMDGYSVLTGDIDNDGKIDIITTQEKDTGAVYLNQGNWQFSKAQDTGTEVFAGDTRGAVFWDYENDGDLDIVMARKDIFNIFKQNNLSSLNNYLKVNCNGPGGIKGGYGTKIWLYEKGKANDINYLIGFSEINTAAGYLSHNSATQHFGLGSHSSCDLVAAFTDGTKILWPSVTSNQTVLITPEVNCVHVKTRIYLQGCYAGNGIMLKNNVPPLQTPYTVDPAYEERIVTSIPENIIDWVLVSLHNTDNDSVLTVNSAFLRNDGFIVGDDGTTESVTLNAAPGSYYISVSHRNHISIMSSIPVLLESSKITNYDFTTAQSKYRSLKSAAPIDSSRWGMYGGDINQDGEITTTDYTIWYNQARNGCSGYADCDLNFDGEVTTTDYTIWYNNARIGVTKRWDE